VIRVGYGDDQLNAYERLLYDGSLLRGGDERLLSDGGRIPALHHQLEPRDQQKVSEH
tara:strand:- start:439 stop:609 length:171 start_codon:yes stop_codon:yes gene_type:complete